MTTYKDPTFRNYTSARAHAYASARGGYSPELYAFILARHAATGGAFGTLLDVGCGPGSAARDLAPSFDHAVGADPGPEMIAAARQLGGVTKGGEQMSWCVAGAEELVEKAGLPEGGVDLLTAATAAHWFDLPAFWRQAARLVKPGGSVAIFTKSGYSCHPKTPNRDEIQRIFDENEADLERYFLPGNRMARNFYRELALPWDAEDGGPPEFPREDFERHMWNVDGSLDGEGANDFFGGSVTLTFPQMEKLMGTASVVTRWREDHPETKDTDKDVVKAVLKKVHDVAGTSELTMGVGYTLLFFKRK